MKFYIEQDGQGPEEIEVETIRAVDLSGGFALFFICVPGSLTDSSYDRMKEALDGLFDENEARFCILEDGATPYAFKLDKKL